MNATDRLRTPVGRAAAALACVLAGALAALAQAPPKVTVADVVVQGNRRVPTQQVQAQLKTRAGGEYTQAAAEDDVRALVATRQFANVEVRTRTEADGRVTVYFLLREYPSRVEKVIYQGARHLKDEDLNNLTGIKVGSILNPLANKAACQAIVKRLNEDGRPFASCDLLKGGDLQDTACTEVVFNIVEGPVVKVRAIKFAGNTFVSGPVLSTHINSSRKALGLFGGQFNPAMADNDIRKLEDYYRAFGYLDVKVARELRYADDAREVELIYHVNEGPRYHLGADPKLAKLRYLPEDQVAQLTKVKAGDVYDQAKIDKDLNSIKDYIGRQGREVRAQATPVFSKDTPGVVTVLYEVEERPPARVGQVFIVGNTRTRQDIILNQVPLYPGQILTYPDLRVAERNLTRLGIFNSPDGAEHPTVTVLNPESDSEFKDIMVTVQEQNTGSLLFGVGVNSDAGLTGSIVLNERNFDITRFPTSWEDFLSGNAFRGGGQEFRAEAVPGTQLQRYSVTWRDPFFLNTPYSLAVSGYYYQRQFDEYQEDRLGGRVTVGRKLSKEWSASVGLRVEDVGVHGVSPFAPIDYQSVDGDNLLVGLRAGVTRDTRDSILRPTEGSLLDISYEQCFGDHVFPLVNVDYNKFFTVYQRADGSGRHVLSAHSQFAWAGDNTPVYERYFAGGFRSLRGFAFRGVGPSVDGFKTGGDFMFLNSLEYQVPVTAGDKIYVVGFVDSGTVESRIDTWTDYRVAAGFGLRLTVPMLGPVPIALDFGFPIVKGPEDREQVFSFWLGFSR
jgi:outer membrane protein assembly complex protein YaeT